MRWDTNTKFYNLAPQTLYCHLSYCLSHAPGFINATVKVFISSMNGNICHVDETDVSFTEILVDPLVLYFI